MASIRFFQLKIDLYAGEVPVGTFRPAPGWGLKVGRSCVSCQWSPALVVVMSLVSVLAFTGIGSGTSTVHVVSCVVPLC